MSIVEAIGGTLAVLGAAVFVVASIGLHRFPDVYTRNSAVGTAAGLGIALVTIGAALVHPRTGTVVIVMVAVVLQLITASLAAILVGRAAVNSRHQFTPGTDTSALGDIPEIGEDPSGSSDNPPG